MLGCRQFSAAGSVFRRQAIGGFGFQGRGSVLGRFIPQIKNPRRFFNIHEYQAMELFSANGVPVPFTKVVNSVNEIDAVSAEIPTSEVVVKAQVLAGGRGKGHFDTGFQGGVHMAKSSAEAKEIASKMIGHNLITKQTGAKGKPCNKVMLSEKLELVKECYFAVLMDRGSGGPMLVASSQGGMDIEQVAKDTPEAIHKESIDIKEGLRADQVNRVVAAFGWTEGTQQAKDATLIVERLYEMFLKTDAVQIEINPLAETKAGRVLCCDGKLNFDQNAEFRQQDIFEMRDPTQEDPREVHAEKFDLNYIGLEGDIGCLVNGAGLAMATMDVIKLKGGDPANFLDVGGGATTEQVTEACKLLDSDPNVKAILVNIFGGIMRCDVIAEGLISAANEIGLNKPMIVRLEGTNLERARELLKESGLNFLTADNLDDAAEKAVQVAQGKQ